MSSKKPFKRRPQIAAAIRVLHPILEHFFASPKAPGSDPKRPPKPTPPETSQDDPRRGHRDHPRQAKPSQASKQACEQRPLHVTPLPSKQASKAKQSKAKQAKQSKASKQASRHRYFISPFGVGLAECAERLNTAAPCLG